MTIAKTKPRRPSVATRKRIAQHHNRSNRYMRTYWPYLPIVAVIMVGLAFNSRLSSQHHAVLGYATDLSTPSLVDGTNVQRAAYGLKPLILNDRLTKAAQAKANDMVARNYWSHDTPDGKTPWTFVVASGYNYQVAGENLAFGFSSADTTMTAWMNSPEHRANLLNSNFSEVGFGFANSPNYINDGPETVIVAEYAEPISSLSAASNTSNQSNVQATVNPTVSTAQNMSTQNTSPQSSGSQKVSRIQTLTATNASWIQFGVGLLASLALLVFLLRHSLVWHRVIRKSEKFFLHHPYVDILLISIVMLGYILLQTSGTIQ